VEAMKQTPYGLLAIHAERSSMRRRQGDLDTLGEVPSIKVTVSDSGCGIPSSDLEAIFAPFYTTKESGTGLGLSIVHAIVTEHGGQIDVKSVLGRGTSFSVSFPAAETLIEVRDS